MRVDEIKKRVIRLDEKDKEILEKAYCLLLEISSELHPNYDYAFDIPKWDEEVFYSRLGEISSYADEIIRWN